MGRKLPPVPPRHLCQIPGVYECDFLLEGDKRRGSLLMWLGPGSWNEKTALVYLIGPCWTLPTVWRLFWLLELWELIAAVFSQQVCDNFFFNQPWETNIRGHKTRGSNLGQGIWEMTVRRPWSSHVFLPSASLALEGIVSFSGLYILSFLFDPVLPFPCPKSWRWILIGLL